MLILCRFEIEAYKVHLLLRYLNTDFIDRSLISHWQRCNNDQNDCVKKKVKEYTIIQKNHWDINRITYNSKEEGELKTSDTDYHNLIITETFIKEKHL